VFATKGWTLGKGDSAFYLSYPGFEGRGIIAVDRYSLEGLGLSGFTFYCTAIDELTLISGVQSVSHSSLSITFFAINNIQSIITMNVILSLH
jgi:hypothetical protein